ncbi:MAG: FUSC family protein [Gemmataceae bacterium]|nr:FUSC family protein [Gemmataceae bacterium]
MSAKHALKTAIAAALTLLFYRILALSDTSNEIWAVVSAVIVMQSNLGSSFKASANRIQGTAIGALIGVLSAWLVGVNILSLGMAVGLTVLVCSRLNWPESLRLAGATTAVVMLGVRGSAPWEMGWQRFLDIVTGIGMALAVQILVLPSRAGRELRHALADTLRTCGEFYRTAATAYLDGDYVPTKVEAVREASRLELRRALDLLQDVKSEPMGHREEDAALPMLVGQVQDSRVRVLAVDAAARDRLQDAYYLKLEPHLTRLIQVSADAFAWLAQAMRGEQDLPPRPDLEQAVAAVDAEFARLRQQHATREFSIDEVLRFCTFYFSVRALARDLQTMAERLRPGDGRITP